MILYTEYIKRISKTIDNLRETHNAEKNFVSTDAHLPIFTLRRIRRILVAHERKKRKEGKKESKKSGNTFHMDKNRKGKDNDRSDVCSLTRLKS